MAHDHGYARVEDRRHRPGGVEPGWREFPTELGWQSLTATARHPRRRADPAGREMTAVRGCRERRRRAPDPDHPTDARWRRGGAAEGPGTVPEGGRRPRPIFGTKSTMAGIWSACRRMRPGSRSTYRKSVTARKLIEQIGLIVKCDEPRCHRAKADAWRWAVVLLRRWSPGDRTALFSRDGRVSER